MSPVSNPCRFLRRRRACRLRRAVAAAGHRHREPIRWCRSEAAPAAAPAPFPKARFQPWGVDATAADPSVKPGDDFWAFVNGGWDKRTQIDPQRTYAGINSVLNDQLDKDVRTIIEDMARDPGANGVKGQQIGDFYASWMDEAGIEARGTAPLAPGARPHRRRRQQGRAVAPCSRRTGFTGAGRLRHLSRPQGSDPLRALRRPGRARHARPRLLSAAGREIRPLPRRLSRTISRTC